MVRRTVWAVGLIAASLLAVIGLIVAPDVLLGAAALGAMTAAAAVGLPSGWRSPRWGALTAWLSEAVPPPVETGVPPAALTLMAEIDDAVDVGATSPADRVRAMSTEGICVAWQRSYWRLRDRPPDTRPLAVVHLRASLLDELERRDPDGFARWLATEPRPVSNPGPFLAADL